LLWIECLTDWRAWAQLEVDKENGIIEPLMLPEQEDTELDENEDKAEEEEELNERKLHDHDFNFEDASRAVGQWGAAERTWD